MSERDPLFFSHEPYPISDKRGVNQLFEGKRVWYETHQARKVGVITRRDFLKIMQTYHCGGTYHYVYAFLRDDGKILYIGQTYDFDKRMRSHKEKHWWKSVSKICLERHHCKKFAYNREQILIDRLSPEHNKQGRRHKKIVEKDIPPIFYGYIDKHVERVSHE
jgi:predicted GIY-YIG superfamily endonuclease